MQVQNGSERGICGTTHWKAAIVRTCHKVWLN